MKALKILFGSFLIAVLLVTALALPVWYVYSQGNRFVRESEQVARNRALEMGITLNTLSGESLYYDNLIALSHTMHMVVRQSETRKDAFQIREIFFVDKDGKLIAHSDIAKLAADSGVSYDKDKFQFGQLRFKGDPLSLEVTQRVKPDFGPLVAKIGATPLFERLLAFMLPDLTASDYHLAGSVYMPMRRCRRARFTSSFTIKTPPLFSHSIRRRCFRPLPYRCLAPALCGSSSPSCWACLS